jgi:hypothetical protein
VEEIKKTPSIVIYGKNGKEKEKYKIEGKTKNIET